MPKDALVPARILWWGQQFVVGFDVRFVRFLSDNRHQFLTKQLPMRRTASFTRYIEVAQPSFETPTETHCSMSIESEITVPHVMIRIVWLEI